MSDTKTMTETKCETMISHGAERTCETMFQPLTHDQQIARVRNLDLPVDHLLDFAKPFDECFPSDDYTIVALDITALDEPTDNPDKKFNKKVKTFNSIYDKNHKKLHDSTTKPKDGPKTSDQSDEMKNLLYRQAWQRNHEINDKYKSQKERWDTAIAHDGYYKAYAHDTTEWMKIDVDWREVLHNPDIIYILKRHPFHLSVTKNLVSIFVHYTKMPPVLHKSRTTAFGNRVDILGKHNWSFVPTNALVFNSHLFEQEGDPLLTCLEPYLDVPVKKTPKSVTTQNKKFKDISDKDLHDYLHLLATQGEFDTYEGWFKIGSALKALGDNDKAFELFHKYSKMAKNYNSREWQHEVRYKFDAWTPTSVGYIINRYREFRDTLPLSTFVETLENRQEKFLLERIKQNRYKAHTDLLQVYLQFPEFKYRYRRCSTTKEFFELDLQTNLWNSCGTSFNITTFVIDVFMPFIENLISKTHDKDLLKIFEDLRNDAGNFSMINQISKNLSSFISEKDFVVKLDSNPNIMSFTNGVYEVLTNTFRPSEPEDYLTLSTHVEYYGTIPADAQLFFENFLETVCLLRDEVDNERLEFFKKLVCIFMFGGNTTGVVPIFTGEGGNGKSMLVMLHQFLGDYVQNLPPTILTHKRTEARSFSPLANCHGARLINMTEPDDQSKIQGGVLKELSGDKMISVRKLYGHPFKMPIQFVLCLSSNEIPKITLGDDTNSLQRRIVIHHFPNIFVDSSKNLQNQPTWRYKDGSLENKIETYGKYWPSFLIQMFRKYYGDGSGKENFVLPEKYVEVVKKYIDESNEVGSWITSNYELFDKDAIAYKRKKNSDGEWENTNEELKFEDGDKKGQTKTWKDVYKVSTTTILKHYISETKDFAMKAQGFGVMMKKIEGSSRSKITNKKKGAVSWCCRLKDDDDKDDFSNGNSFSTLPL